MGDTQIWLDITKNVCQSLLILSVEMIFIFEGFANGQIDKIG